ILRVRLDRTAMSKERGKLDSDLEGLAPLRAKLLDVRDRRKQPLRDEKIVLALNGLTIAALAHAGAVFDELTWIMSAKRASEYLWIRAFDENAVRLRHHIYRDESRGEGFLDDYARLALGFLALHDATDEPIWLTRATLLARAIAEQFVKEDGAVVTTTVDA